jgi:hypothetical protein
MTLPMSPVRLALLLAALAAAAPATAQTGAVDATACPDPQALKRGFDEPLATIRYLADDALEGRLAGSTGERCAGDYIAGRFRAIGLAGAGPDGSYFQDVPLASALNPHAPGGTGRNVLALLEGTDPSLRAEVIVVGAHYDHLGLGGAGSMAPGQSAVHNGADDNASGVAALLRVATLLAAGPRPARSVLFMAFTGEESGLLGSAHFTREPTVPLADMQAMINMDMVGRLGDDPLIVYGAGTALQWRDLLEPAATTAGVQLALRPEGYGPSDHTSFYMNDVPVLHFFTNTHADYHRPSDVWDRIDAAGVEKVARIVADVTRSLAAAQTRITLQQGAGEPPRPAVGGYGAWLGTVPDFTPVDRGVLLGGVTPGSPGEQAGLRQGDILVGLGGRPVRDLEGFTEALRAHRPGDDVEVVVLRAGSELTLRAVLGSRDR